MVARYRIHGQSGAIGSGVKHVTVDLTQPAGHLAAYQDGRYDLALRGLTQIAVALANAGCRVTALLDPAFAARPPAAALSTAPVAIIPTLGHDGLVAALGAMAPDACVLWNGTHMPTVTAACHAAAIPIVFAEAGWFDRDSSVFVDPVGVTFSSSLCSLGPPAILDSTIRARLAPIADAAGRRRHLPGDYLLLLLDGGGWTYFDPRHRDPAVIIAQLRQRFPAWQLAVRAHPLNRDAVRRSLPPDVTDANDGDLRDWAAFCTAAIGASSKAMFTPVLYGRPAIMIGAHVAAGLQPHPGFVQRQRITAIDDDDLTDDSRASLARAFVYEAVFHRHLYFDDSGPAGLRQNRVIAPLLTG